MKTKKLVTLALLVLPLTPTFSQSTSPTSGAVETNGFLVFAIERCTSGEGHPPKGSVVRQKFKVPLTELFLSNFNHVSSETTMGSEFYCSGGNLTNSPGSTRFTWWIHKTADNHWSVRMWGMGFETIKGVHLNSENPNVTQCVTIKKLEDLDMSYNLSYVNMYDSVGVSFGAKYVSAKDMQAQGIIPTAPVKKADHSDLFKGNLSTNCPIMFQCAFQED